MEKQEQQHEGQGNQNEDHRRVKIHPVVPQGTKGLFHAHRGLSHITVRPDISIVVTNPKQRASPSKTSSPGKRFRDEKIAEQEKHIGETRISHFERGFHPAGFLLEMLDDRIQYDLSAMPIVPTVQDSQ